MLAYSPERRNKCYSFVLPQPLGELLFVRSVNELWASNSRVRNIFPPHLSQTCFGRVAPEFVGKTVLVSFAFFGEQLNYLTCLIGKQFSCVIATQSPRQARDLSCFNSGQFRSAARAFTWHQGIVALRIICFHCTGRICVTGCNVKWGVGGPDA